MKKDGHRQVIFSNIHIAETATLYIALLRPFSWMCMWCNILSLLKELGEPSSNTGGARSIHLLKNSLWEKYDSKFYLTATGKIIVLVSRNVMVIILKIVNAISIFLVV